jgi:hypothetical protein
MDLGGIVEDAVKYPFSDWKKILLLGILTMISSIGVAMVFIGSLLGIKNVLVTIIIFILAYVLIGFFVSGYNFRIIKTSINGAQKIPEFKSWVEMFIDGIKVSLVFIFYSLPAILIVIFAGISVYPILHGLTTDPSSANIYTILTVISAVILFLIALLYIIIILPLNYMAVAYMADNDSKFSFAFRFREILDKIGSIGWGNLIIWYLVIGTIYMLITIMGSVLTGVFSILTPFFGIIVTSLFITPYLNMYLNRSIAMIYISK